MHTKNVKSKKIRVVTLGCSKNLVDSETLMGQLYAENLAVTDSETDPARIVVINTCGFIKDAKQESIDTILQFIRAKQEGMIDQLVVMGCLSERYKKDLEKEIPDVDKYFGVNDLEAIIKHFGLNYKNDLIGERILTTPPHYAYLKISEGCDRRCSFCAIPNIRGKHLSKTPEHLVHEANLLAAKGVKELILIAQDLTRYGVDLYHRQALPDLLEKLSDVKGIEWIRLHYAYPAGFPKKVIRIMKERQNVCNYLDIPFQHGSDKVLAKMRRGHTSLQNYELIDYIRKMIPDITLRTTLITGHPGETAKEYEKLKKFVEDVRFDRLGVFTYSEEEDTYAALKYKDSIPERIKKDRADEIMSIQQEISTTLNHNKIGKSFKVMVDRWEGEYFIGRTESDSPEIDNEVLISSGNKKLATGRFYPVIVTGAEEFDLLGRPE
ncbi:MAG TPA: 30S ribosomal protein S12 methylthiotransferase RimO [Bacteroidales bacterium]|nr:30S ribosomal protein S12 methylthiotransferase RimO [Bacteroidales bacterium]